MPHLEWSVRRTVAHVVEAAYFCGVDLAAGELGCGRRRLADQDAPPPELLVAGDGRAAHRPRGPRGTAGRAGHTPTVRPTRPGSPRCAARSC